MNVSGAPPLFRARQSLNCLLQGDERGRRSATESPQQGLSTFFLCPRKALADLPDGDLLKVVATDPGSVKDGQAFVNQTGSLLLVAQVGRVHFLHRDKPEKGV